MVVPMQVGWMGVPERWKVQGAKWMGRDEGRKSK